MSSVLLVDTEPTVLLTILDKVDFDRRLSVRTARSLPEALDSAREFPPDVVWIGLPLTEDFAGYLPELYRTVPQASVLLAPHTNGKLPQNPTTLGWSVEAAFDHRFSSGSPIPGPHTNGDGLDGLREFTKARLAAGSDDLWEEVRKQVDAVVLPIVLSHTRGNQQQAAAKLGVARQTLRTRLRELGLAPALNREPI